MARLYSNENFPRRVVVALRSLGHDVLTSMESDKANQRIPDEEVLRYATEQSRAVLTLNRRDFIQLHKESSAHAGIIVCTFDSNVTALAQRISSVLAVAGDPAGKLLRVVKPG